MDCTISLSLDPLYTKAYLRRGTARLGLQKYTAAKEDYERVLSLEPQNKKAKTDLEIIEKVCYNYSYLFKRIFPGKAIQDFSTSHAV